MRSGLPFLAIAAGAIGALGVGLVRHQGPPAATSTGVSPFERAKVERLLRQRLPCLGCHALDGQGGRIGPDLSAVGARRTRAAIERMIADPQSMVPGTVMPRVPMTGRRRALLARYLSARGGPRTEPDSGPAPGPSAPPPADGAALYARYCAACHGGMGRGDGPNARYLPVRPAVHADSAAMAARPDDALFDVIAAGGGPMGKSPRMPPFGETLTAPQIRALVAQIRRLCRCAGPGWSTDGGG